MEGATVHRLPLRVKVVLLEGRGLPGSTLWLSGINEYKTGTQKATYDVNISVVRSVSGLATDVLKFGPFCTVNHCPFLE